MEVDAAATRPPGSAAQPPEIRSKNGGKVNNSPTTSRIAETTTTGAKRTSRSFHASPRMSQLTSRP